VAGIWAVDTVAGMMVADMAEEALEWNWARAAADSSEEYTQEGCFAEVDSGPESYKGLRTFASSSDFRDISYIHVLA